MFLEIFADPGQDQYLLLHHLAAKEQVEAQADLAEAEAMNRDPVHLWDLIVADQQALWTPGIDIEDFSCVVVKCYQLDVVKTYESLHAELLFNL